VWPTWYAPAIDRCSSKLLLLRDGGNGQISVFRQKNLDLESDFQKFSKAYSPFPMGRGIIIIIGVITINLDQCHRCLVDD